MLVKSILFTIILFSSVIYLAYNLYRLYTYLTLAQPENRSDQPGKRIMNMLKIAIGQTKIFRDWKAGPLHAGIFWGFLVLLFSASESIIQGYNHEFSWNFLGPFYSLISVSTDIFCVIVFVAVIISFIRRFVIKVPRLQGDESERQDAMIVLGCIFVIVTSLLLENSFDFLLFPDKNWSYHPIASLFSDMFPDTKLIYFYEAFWWIHIMVIFAFMNYLPFSKHLHVYTSIQNVYYSQLTPANKLKPIDFEREGVEKFGVADIEDFTWKNIFDSYSCTHCGRCTSVCPANQTGKVLDPRQIIIQTRQRTFDRAPILLKQKAAGDNPIELSFDEKKIMDKKFIGEYQNIDALWQCTTCGACMQECPINIEHVPAIVDMRRSLVMMESDFPPLLQSAFTNLENNGSPWAFSSAERADWAEGTGVKTAAENPDFDVLFWVGCAGSFDDRAKKISRAFSKLMQIADINFSILGTEEQCNGDVARRSGNEYLAGMLVKANIETLNRYNVKKIVTTCPHCFNTFKNEYPDFGAKYEVVHHTVFLTDLIKSGKLKIDYNSGRKEKITYHDSCYLGRYNNIYEEPRAILSKLPGFEFVETRRHGDKGLCCGAGGAQMFMEETEGKRVNIERTEELLETGAKCVTANCPFCMTMLTDGVKAKDKVEEVEVKDIAEILLEHVQM